MNFTVKEKEVGQRLDVFLTKKIKNKTRSQIKKLLQDGQILINDQNAKVHQFLKLDDKITIKKLETDKIEEIKEDTKIIEPGIIFENSDFLVIDKPVGLLVHPTDKGEKNTLVAWLIQKYKGIERVGESKYRAGIVHRLDKDVSGVMVVAKNNKTYNHLKTLFKNREVTKHYTALVYGKTSEEQGEINLPIGRNKEGQFVARPLQGAEKFDEKDKVAKTTFKVIEYIKEYSLLDVEILTGRTHQIRAHLSAVGHPIIGDQIYKPKKKFFNLLRTKIKVIELPRIFLHSTKLGFIDLKGEKQEFHSPLPQELTEFLNEQKGK